MVGFVMKVKYTDIDYAYIMANAEGYGENTALLDKKTGKFYFHSEYGDCDGIPEEAWESEDTVEIPRKNDLDLGTRLVFRFVRNTFPNGYDKVSKIFSRRGAYARYMDWLITNDLLKKWYDYSNAAEEKAIREWCADNGIELEG